MVLPMNPLCSSASRLLMPPSRYHCHPARSDSIAMTEPSCFWKPALYCHVYGILKSGDRIRVVWAGSGTLPVRMSSDVTPRVVLVEKPGLPSLLKDQERTRA